MHLFCQESLKTEKEWESCPGVNIELVDKMVKTYQIKWRNCQTWKGSRCPHKQIIEELERLIELKNLSELKESFQSKILKRANSFCEKCEYFNYK